MGASLPRPFQPTIQEIKNAMPSNPNNCNNCDCTPNPLDSANWVSESTIAKTDEPSVKGSKSGSGSASVSGSPAPPTGGVSLTVSPGILCCGAGKKISATASATGKGAAKKDVTLNWPGGSKTKKGSASHTYTVKKADCGTVLWFSGEANQKTKKEGVPVVLIKTKTEAMVPANRARTKLGVCEDDFVALTPSIGTVKWKLTGQGSITSKTSHDTLYSAPDRASASERLEATFTTTKQETGEPKSIACSVTFNVIEPTGVSLENAQDSRDWHVYGLMSAGVCAKVRVLPRDVCFYQIQIREADGIITSSGYWASLNGKTEKVDTRWNPVQQGTNSYPSIKAGIDRVTGHGSNKPITKGGRLKLKIPLYFKGAIGTEKKYGEVTHFVRSDSSGWIYIFKAGAEAEHDFDDASVNLGCCPNPKL